MILKAIYTLLFLIFLIGCENEEIKEIKENVSKTDIKPQKKKTVTQEIHYSSYLEAALSIDPELSIPTVKMFIDGRRGHLLDIVWLQGNNATARSMALEYFLRLETHDASLYIQKVKSLDERYGSIDNWLQQIKMAKNYYELFIPIM